MKATLRKVTWNKGQTESGAAYDYTRVFIEVPVYDASAKEFGYDTMQCEYGDESKHAELLHLRGQLPIEVDIDIVPVKKGSQVLQQVRSMRVIEQPPKTQGVRPAIENK